MTVGQANKIVRGLIGEDDFHDVEDVIASYYSIAQCQIATTVCPIIKTKTLVCGESVLLPDDLFRIKNIPASYTREGAHNILIDGKGTVQITYYAYPKALLDDCPENTPFELDEEAQNALPYYAAAQTVLADSDMRRYNTFMDTYNNILSNIAVNNKHAIMNIVSLEG